MELKKTIRDQLIKLGVLPSRFQWPNPFKIIEFEELTKKVPFKKTDIILDFGCGAGKPDFLISKRVKKVYGIDISLDQIAKAKELCSIYNCSNKVEFLCTALQQAPFLDQQFDKIISLCVLEHVMDYEQVLNIFYRLLKKGGMVLLSVDCLSPITDKELLKKHRIEGKVYKYFCKEELYQLLDSCGFRNIEIFPIFKSIYAKETFEEGIRNSFLSYHQYSKFIPYFLMRFAEWKNSTQEKGIFLCVKAYKNIAT